MSLIPSVMVADGLDVGLVCDDAAAMRQFYGEVLGFEETFEMPLSGSRSLVFFAYGASSLKLQVLADPPPKHRGGIDEACGYRLLTIGVPSIAAVSQRNVAAGRKEIASASLAELGFDPPTGVDDPDSLRLAFVADPDGNLVELVQGGPALGLTAVGLTVADAEASRRFWVDIVGGDDLGTAPIVPPLEKRDVRIKGTIVKFWQHETPPPAKTGPITDHVGIRYVTATVRDAPAVYDALVAAGATPDVTPTELIPGVTIGFVRDPDGNQLELVGA